MNDNEYGNRILESTLENLDLTECRELSEFAKDDSLGKVATEVDAGYAYVTLHYVDRRAVVVIDYIAGLALYDTAYVGDLADCHLALRRAAEHGDLEVIRDDFDTEEVGGSR